MPKKIKSPETEANKKINCWEYYHCGREPGGARVDENGACAAATDESFGGINGGINGGRVCWAVAGTLCHGDIQETLCHGDVQGTVAEKRERCVNCAFYQKIREEGRQGSSQGMMPRVKVKDKERIQKKLFKRLIPSILLIFFVVGGSALFFESLALKSELDKKAHLSVKILAGMLNRSIWNFDDPHMKQMCDVMVEDDEIAAIAVFNIQGALLYKTGDPDIIKNFGKAPAPNHIFFIEKEIIRKPSGEKLGKVRIYFSNLPTKKKQQNMILFYILSLLILILAIIFITRNFFRRIIVAPLHYLMDGINRITNETIYYPLEVTAKDEIGHLTISFNEMMKRINDYANNLEKKVEDRTWEIVEKNRIIRNEQEKSEKLLLNILPAAVADDLKKYGKTEPRSYKNVTVFFSDIVEFTKMSSTLSPKFLIGELNDIFTIFDRTIKENQCQRIKTIGDAYLAVCGMHEKNERHADNMVIAALEIIRRLKERNKKNRIQWRIRIGVHSGDIAGGIVGTDKYIYDVFGDAINTASRMEQNSEPMKVNISGATHGWLKDKFTCIQRDSIHIKGKGKMSMYFVESGPVSSTDPL